MARSAPILNRPMPTTSSTALTVKAISSAFVSSKTGVSASMYTSTVTGSADTSASLIFSISCFNAHHLSRTCITNQNDKLLFTVFKRTSSLL